MMKSVLSFFLIIFSCQYSAAQSRPATAETADAAPNPNFRHNPNILGTQCSPSRATKSLTELEILGKSIAELEPGIVIQGCVMARNTAEAFRACGANYSIINLSNAQYDEDLADTLYNSRGRDPTPFYCIQGNYRMADLKARRCAELRADADIMRQFEVRWTTPAGRDGSCQVKQRSQGRNAPWELHNEDFEQLVRTASRSGLQDVPVSVLSSEELIRPANIDVSSLIQPLNINLGEDIDTKLNTCITRWRDRANLCKSGADEVLRTCSENRAAPGETVSQSAGTQQTLFDTGARLSGTQDSLSRQLSSCTEGANFCTTSCNPDQVNQMAVECLHETGQSTEALLNSTYPDLGQTLQSAKTEVRDLFREGKRICTAQVPSQRLNLNNVLNSVVSAIRVAAVGSCQTSASNGQNCAQIPTIPDCQTNPGLSGCNVYSQMGSCAVGSVYYNAPACACARNPTSCATRTNTTADTTSSFGGNLAGASVPQNSGGAVSFGGGGGGSSGGGSFSDLSIPGGGGSAVSANLAGNIKAGEISTGGGATGASVGGGGGSNGGTGLAGNVSGTAGPPPEKGIGSLFKDLKNVVSNAFRGGTKSAPSAQKANGAINTDRFKPNTKLRGGPVQRDIASANEKTLFELVNDCANGLRCKNSGDMLVNP